MFIRRKSQDLNFFSQCHGKVNYSDVTVRLKQWDLSCCDFCFKCIVCKIRNWTYSYIVTDSNKVYTKQLRVCVGGFAILNKLHTHVERNQIQ